MADQHGKTTLGVHVGGSFHFHINNTLPVIVLGDFDRAV